MTMMMVLMTFPDTINTFRIGFFQRNRSSSPGQRLHITRSRQTRGMILWEQSYFLHFLWERLHFFLLIIGPSSDHCLALSPAHSISQFVDPLPNMWQSLELLHGFIKVFTYSQLAFLCVSRPLQNQTNFKISKLLKNLHLNWRDFVSYGLIWFGHQNPVSKLFFANIV